MMKTVILAGGYGTRISEETHLKPKPMVEIGGRPILWHIMKIYSAHGINDFIICLGYKGYYIKEYFANYFLHQSDITFDIANNKMLVHHKHAEPWRVTLVDTGQDTGTGGRLKRIADYLEEETFCFTYGDGVGDIDMTRLIAFHREHGKMATVTAVQPPSRFGVLDVQSEIVTSVREKPQNGARINGGFFVLNKSVIPLIKDDGVMWERAPMETLTAQGQLAAYNHNGFWQCMDTQRDQRMLENLWRGGKAPWKIWE